MENLYPSNEHGGDFTSILHLDDVEGSVSVIVRKVLSAGAALCMVEPSSKSNAYLLHSDFYRLLTKLRPTPSLLQASTPVLINGLTGETGPTRTFAPTEAGISRALDDIVKEVSDFVILERNVDQFSDYIQVAKGLSPYHIKSRVWLNEQFFEHFHILDPGALGGEFALIIPFVDHML